MFFAACNGEGTNEEGTTDSTEVVENVAEFNLLASYLEEAGDFINTKRVPTIIPAEKVNKNLDETQLIIDIRKAKDFAVDGHIEGAVNVKLEELLNYFENNDTKAYDKVVLVCYSGQTASYGASVLQLSGYENVYAMKWGMSGWNPKFAEKKWAKAVSNKYADVLEVTPNTKNKAGDYPVIETGLKTGEEIFKQRAQEAPEIDFHSIALKADKLMEDPSAYYIINYWPQKLYKKGHIKGAVQYDPKKSLNRDNFLATLPADKPIITYCFTGQHAAFVTAYLNILGYDAGLLLYGANSFMNTKMVEDEIGHAYDASHTKDFSTITSEYDEPANEVEVE